MRYQIYGNISMLSDKSRKVNINDQQEDVHHPARIKGIENNT